MADYIIYWDKLTIDKDRNIVNEKHSINVNRCTKREVDRIVDDLALNLNYSNIRLERIDFNYE